MAKKPKLTDKRKNFNKWWRKNSHRQTGHHWLTKTANRILHEYAVPPEMFDECKRIIKRYNLSEYKRMNSTDAYTLWRLTHPDMDERIKRLASTAAFFAQQKYEYKKIKKAVDAGE